MDLTIKAKAFEIEALDYLDQGAPEIYKGKRCGLYWAVHEVAAIAEDIDWEECARIRLENYFSGKQYEDNIPPITHLMAEEEEYKKIACSMEKQFGLKRPIQKAYCIRNIIKYAVRHSDTEVDIGVPCMEVKPDNEKLEAFKRFSIDEKLEAVYTELLCVRKLLEKNALPFSYRGVK